MHPHAPVCSAELPPLFQQGGEATRRATLGRVGEAVRDPSGGGRGCTSPCATREVGSLWRQRVGVSGQHATPADWGREKEQGSTTTVAREGSGKQRATLAAEGEAPLPLNPTQAPTSACASVPATSTCAWGMRVAHMRVASVVGGAGQREGVGVGRETAVMAHSVCSPTHPAPNLEKKNSP